MTKLLSSCIMCILFFSGCGQIQPIVDFDKTNKRKLIIDKNCSVLFDRVSKEKYQKRTTNVDGDEYLVEFYNGSVARIKHVKATVKSQYMDRSFYYDILKQKDIKILEIIKGKSADLIKIKIQKKTPFYQLVGDSFYGVNIISTQDERFFTKIKESCFKINK